MSLRVPGRSLEGPPESPWSFPVRKTSLWLQEEARFEASLGRPWRSLGASLGRSLEGPWRSLRVPGSSLGIPSATLEVLGGSLEGHWKVPKGPWEALDGPGGSRASKCCCHCNDSNIS